MKSKTQDALLGFALIAFSLVMLGVMFAGATYCDFDPNAIQGECLKSIYRELIR